MIKNVLNISDLSFGGKAYGLNKLNKLNVPVPTAYAINQSFINSIIERKQTTINELIKILNSFDSKTKFAIRSSASNEDGTEKSFAGMYESILNVSNNIEDIIIAIEKVNNSSVSNRIVSYNDDKIVMNIVIQEMISPKIAGVCFTDAIDLNGNDSIYIEYVDGLGESLVSGKKTAKSVVVSLSDYSYRCEDEKDRDLFIDLIKNLKKIRNDTTEALDIEWCITEDNKAYFVQARPITKKIIIREKLSTGAIASPGSCKGKVYIIDEDADDDIIEEKIKKFPKGAILIAKTTDTNYVPAMKKASGIITTEGSVLSHAAIIAREFGIPCITGYKDAFKLFEEGKEISIDTNSQTIIYDGNKISFGTGKEINLLELYNFENIIEEEINGNIVLVECINDEFGIHIEEELKQDEIDNIIIFIRKKYKRNPIVLIDQKYLWYFEFKRYRNFSNFDKYCREATNICNHFQYNELDVFVTKLLNEIREIFNICTNDYDYTYAREYAQAIHFLINLYMCNGTAMIAINRYIQNSSISSVQTILNNDTIQSKFLKKIESIRGSVWKIFLDNKWSSDDYYDDREEKIATAINYQGNKEDAIDIFYSNLKKPTKKSK